MSKKNFFKVFMYLYFFVLHWLSFYFYLQYFVIKMCLKNTIFENYSILWNIICYVLLICQKIFLFLIVIWEISPIPSFTKRKQEKKFVSKRRKRYIFSLKFWKIKENFLKRLNFFVVVFVYICECFWTEFWLVFWKLTVILLRLM